MLIFVPFFIDYNHADDAPMWAKSIGWTMAGVSDKCDSYNLLSLYFLIIMTLSFVPKIRNGQYFYFSYAFGFAYFISISIFGCLHFEPNLFFYGISDIVDTGLPSLLILSSIQVATIILIFNKRFNPYKIHLLAINAIIFIQWWEFVLYCGLLPQA